MKMTPKSLLAFAQKFAIAILLVLAIGSFSACGSQQADPDPENSEQAEENGESTDSEDSKPVAKPTSAINKRSARGKTISHMLIGTGSVQGVYFPVGGVICRLLNRHKSLHNIRCSLESTGGSIYNLRELREGNFDLVFASLTGNIMPTMVPAHFVKKAPTKICGRCWRWNRIRWR